MNTFKYVKCALAGIYSIRGDAGVCYDQERFELPDGKIIEFRKGGIFINGKRVEKPYRGSSVYSDVLEKPKVRLLYMYYMKSVIIPEEKFAFIHSDTSFGPVTFVMYEGETYVGIDTLVTITKIRKVSDPMKVYILQFISDVEKEYFGRNDVERYLKGW